MSRTDAVASWPGADTAPRSFSSALPLLLGLAGLTLLLHFLFNGAYGYFRDELYYIDCGNHLAWGYVDQPPLIAVVARLSIWLLGKSLFDIRFFPALAGAAIVFLTGWMAQELGGGRFAQGLAAIAILFAPAYLAFDNFLSMNAFEPFFWMFCAYLAIRLLKGADQRLWLLFGGVAGVGLLNKHALLVFGLGLVAGLLLTPARRLLRSQWVWLGALVAFGIIFPHLLWEWQHHWPQIETVRNAQIYKNFPISPFEFLIQQVTFLHPLTLPIWLAGLGWYFFSADGKRFRCLGWAYLVILAIFILGKGKSYYPLPAYPMLFAAGGVAMEGWLRIPRRRWRRFAYPAVLVAGGIATLPFGLPMLPVNTFIRYESILPLARHVRTERDPLDQLPQLYADMFGWPNMVATIARVYRSLPAEEQTKCAIWGENYGEAAAVDFFGGAYGLPKAISGHNTYWLWGPRDYTGEVVITVGVPYELLEKMFGEIDEAAFLVSPYAMPTETNLPVYICRKPKASLQQMWPLVRYYI